MRDGYYHMRCPFLVAPELCFLHGLCNNFTVNRSMTTDMRRVDPHERISLETVPYSCLLCLSFVQNHADCRARISYSTGMLTTPRFPIFPSITLRKWRNLQPDHPDDLCGFRSFSRDSLAPLSPQTPRYHSPQLSPQITNETANIKIQKQYPRRKFNIGAMVLNLNEVDDKGKSTGEVRYVREAKYSESQEQWLYL